MYASNGNATWLGYKLSKKVSVLRTDAAADPVEFSSDLTKEKATYGFGNTTSLYIEDVTSESATELDTLSDLIISAIITNPHNESNRTFYKDEIFSTGIHAGPECGFPHTGRQFRRGRHPETADPAQW